LQREVVAAVAGSNLKRVRQVTHGAGKQLTFDLQALGLGSGMQTFGLWRDPEVVGDPIEARSGNLLHLRLKGKIALTTVILHGPQGLEYQEFTHVRALADV
jgi:hypothetical protein